MKTRWLVVPLGALAIPLFALASAACDEDADEPGEVRETVEQGAEEGRETVEQGAEEARETVEGAIDDNEEPTDTPEPGG